MSTREKQSGFTAVELLITLFVAAAFLIASYQLFNLVIKDGGATRAESRAANIAYDYLRQYAASSITIPCTESQPLSDAALTVEGLSSVTISINITCLPDTIDSLSKVEAIISYNNPVQTVKYATYTSSTGSTGNSDITDGLVAWWKLNGNANNSIGAPNGVIANATSVANQAGQANMAYAFNGGNAVIDTGSTFGIGFTNATISLWVNNPSASNHGLFAHIGYLGFGIGMGNTQTDNNGSKIIMLFNGIRWIPTAATITTGWHHVVMTLDGSGTPMAYLDGVATGAPGAYAGANSNTPASSIFSIGTLSGYPVHSFNGTIDDVRLYNRALSLSEVLALYSAGAK
jgi:Tfp pilus assembly protein PilE